MTIENHEKGSKAFYRENVNVISQYRRLLADPEAKLRDNFRQMELRIALCALLLAVLSGMAIARGADTLTVVAIVMMGIVILFCSAILIGMNRTVKNQMEQWSPSVVILDEEGIEHRTENGRIYRQPWESLAFVRVFDRSVCFLPRDISGVMIYISIEHRQQILAFLAEHPVGVRVISP